MALSSNTIIYRHYLVYRTLLLLLSSNVSLQLLFQLSETEILLPQFSSTHLLVHSRSKINYRIRLVEISEIKFVKSFIWSIHIVPRLFYFKFVSKISKRSLLVHSNISFKYLSFNCTQLKSIRYNSNILKKNFFLLWSSLLLQLLQYIINTHTFNHSIYKIILLAIKIKIKISQYIKLFYLPLKLK